MHRPAADSCCPIAPAAVRAAAAPGADAAILDLHPPATDVLAEVLAGLRVRPASLPSKLFYDEAGSRLFDEITRLPEYYPTRTEIGILRACLPALRRLLGRGVTLVEYGSGSSTKTSLLLAALNVRAYVPIDISRWYLATAARRLRAQFPGVDVRPIAADYGQPVRLPRDLEGPLVGFFPGSTIGNFEPPEAVAFLLRVAGTLGPGGRLLIGADLVKDPALLHAAYNDAAGVTAAFNLNLLARLNRELGANFDLAAWRHYAPYVPRLGRIEMHLVAARSQVVRVAGGQFAFAEGESIHTENSHKYTPAGFAALAREGGFEVERVWTDALRLFSVQLLRVR